MKAVVCRDATLNVTERPDPVPEAGQVLLEVSHCGICGSDLHARVHGDDVAALASEVGYHHFMRSSEEVVLGHEFSGTVLDYGPGCRRRWPTGTPVVAIPMLRRGREVHLTGLSAAAPGGYAEQVLAQEAVTFRVPNGLPPRQAALTEPMAVALHAVRRSGIVGSGVGGGIGKRRPAVVIGCGPIGLAVICMLKAQGVRSVVASDFSPRRRELAVACGADMVVDPAIDGPWGWIPGKPVTAVTELMNLGIDTTDRLRRVPKLPWWQVFRAANNLGAAPAGPVVFECVGAPGVLDQVLAGAPLLSRVVVVGVCMETDRIRPAMAINKELDVRFVLGYDPGEFHETLHLIADGKVRVEPLITGTVGLDGVPDAFTELASPDKHAKILVTPGAKS